MKMTAWEVFLNEKHIDTVFYEANFTAEEVRESLVRHDGYSPDITVVVNGYFKGKDK